MKSRSWDQIRSLLNVVRTLKGTKRSLSARTWRLRKASFGRFPGPNQYSTVVLMASASAGRQSTLRCGPAWGSTNLQVLGSAQDVLTMTPQMRRVATKVVAADAGSANCTSQDPFPRNTKVASTAHPSSEKRVRRSAAVARPGTCATSTDNPSQVSFGGPTLRHVADFFWYPSPNLASFSSASTSSATKLSTSSRHRGSTNFKSSPTRYPSLTGERLPYALISLSSPPA
mmetsp:Transcript_54317/g.152995  ORF Transcript_54317/g.152995 Transcript_54317/m.152995 type:complete len:229 (-) Transcript_54317:1024-1710(-)